MHHAHACVTAERGVIDKRTQCSFGFRDRHAMQIDLVLDRIISTSQLSHCAAAYRRALKSQYFGRTGFDLIDVGLQTFFDNLFLVLAPELRAWFWFGFVVGSSDVRIDWKCIVHDAAKQGGIVILGLVVFSRHDFTQWCYGREETLSIVSSPDIEQSSILVKILVSNDDGYLAKGINALVDALSRIADVIVVAPDRNYSGASNSLTLHSPLRVREIEPHRYFVNGTPSDCVNLALSGFLDEDPDIVVSGINHGANLGDDVIYSGTVAAAMEGRFLGLPAISVSLVGPHCKHFDTAARVARDLVSKLQDDPLPKDMMLNVNVPDVPFEQLRGIEAARLGFRHRSEPLVPMEDPQGRRIYWIGPAGEGKDAGPGTDFEAIERGSAVVTPIKVDLTRHEALPALMEWLGR